MRDGAPEGVWQFKASWRSTMGSLTILLLLIAAVLLLVGFAGSRMSPGFIVSGLAAGAFAWLLGKPLFTGAWIVRVGPRGISGHLLNNRTVPWRDVRDLGVETVQGNTFLVLHLAPDATESLQKTKRWLSGRKPERRLVLNALRKDQAKEAAEAAMRTFAERAHEHAAAAVEARREEARFEAAFEQQLAQHTGTTWALYLVVALNVGVWVANVGAGISPMQPLTTDLFRWGAISAWAVVNDHQYWRLLAGTFLHGGLLHLAMNMLGLWSAGKLLNRLYGNPQFLLVYLLSALAGASASLHFSAQTAVSVGASGAVFGILGALIAAIRRHKDTVPKALAKQILTSESVFVIYALVNGFARQGIDNAAHVGGLVAGAAMGWMLAGVIGGERRLPRTATVAAAVVLAIAAMVVTTPAPKVDHASMFAAGEQLERIMPRLRSAYADLQKDGKDAQAGRIAPERLMAAIETVHLPQQRKLLAELRQIPLAQGDPRVDMMRDMQELSARTIEAMELELRNHRGQARAEDAQRVEVLKRESAAITRRMQDRAAEMQRARKP